MKISNRKALRLIGAAVLLAAATTLPAVAAHSVMLTIVPLHPEEATTWCGAATAQMVMDGYPTPPGSCAWTHVQADAAASIVNHEAGWTAEPRGLADAMATLCPLPPGHHWTVISRADPTQVMRAVAFWMTVNDYPVAALLDTTAHHGDPTHQEHWVAIKGIITDADPTTTSTVTLEYVWFNDPGLPLGDPTASKLVTGSFWYTQFQAVAKAGSSFNGNYLAVIEPPASPGRATAPPEVLTGRLISADEALAAAFRAIRDVGLARIGGFDVLDQATPLEPLLVDARYGGYYLIPYAVEGREATAALFVNAYTGGFQEVDAFASATRFLSEDEARQVALRSLKAAQPKAVEAELVSSAEAGSASRSRPLWKVRVDGRTVGVTQDGEVVPGVSGAEHSIRVPARRPYGLAAGNGRLWTTDAETGEILELAPRSGNVVRRISTGVEQLAGLAFDGERLWVADAATRELHAFHPGDGRRLRSLPVQVPPEKGYRSIGGIAWDGTHLWTAIAAGFSSSFNQIDDDGRIVRSLFADCVPRGIVVEDGHLWSLCFNGEGNAPTIDRRDLLPEESAFQRSRVLLERAEGRSPSGLAYDGASLWYLDAGARRAYRYTPARPATARREPQ